VFRLKRGRGRPSPPCLAFPHCYGIEFRPLFRFTPEGTSYLTAEIAIMNKHGVALAADSAVTIATSHGQQKIYNTNKLFMLSKYHPVGVMVYNNADMGDAPWETIIKVYRDQLGTTNFPRLKEYASAFISSLEGNSALFPQAAQTSYLKNLMVRYLTEVKESIDERVKEVTEAGQEINDDRLEQIVTERITHYFGILEAKQLAEGFSAAFEDECKTAFDQVSTEVISRVFEQLPIPAEALEKLKSFAVFLFTRLFNDSDNSGVVIAGFGNDEIYPSFIAYTVYGVANNRVKYGIYKDQPIDTSVSATIQPFAQDEMVHTFMAGIDPSIEKTLYSYLSVLFEMFPEDIIKLLPSIQESERDEFLNKMKEAGAGLIETFRDGLAKFMRKNNVDPVIGTVEYLPLDELAAMAESLVNLTSFKRRITMVPETVGGPIDVAVISKGDGFIWIKRKHYFKADLNPGFLANYYRRGD
jgi:hypothetical protein